MINFLWIITEKYPKMRFIKNLSTCVASLTILQLKILLWEIFCYKRLYMNLSVERGVYINKERMPEVS